MKVFIWMCCMTIPLGTIALVEDFGFFLGAIPTVILYTIGFNLAYIFCRKWDVRVIEKEAHLKGMSVRQYVSSLVPPSLITACESLKGNSAALKDTLKNCVNEEVITKPISHVLFEMYK